MVTEKLYKIALETIKEYEEQQSKEVVASTYTIFYDELEEARKVADSNANRIDGYTCYIYRNPQNKFVIFKQEVVGAIPELIIIKYETVR